jgi:small-conductance mechanosensitive channel
MTFFDDLLYSGAMTMLQHLNRTSLAIALVLIASAPLRGQEGTSTGASSSSTDRQVRVAPIVIDGHSLFSLRGVAAFPAEERASAVVGRIVALAADPNFAESSLTIEERQEATWILANGQRVMAVLNEDAEIEQVARNTLAQVYRRRIWTAIEDYRRDRTPTSLAWHSVHTLGATILLLVLAGLGRRLVKLLRVDLERRFRERSKSLQDRSLNIVKAEQVWRALTGLLNIVWGVSLTLMLFTYLNYVLTLFPWTRFLGKRLMAIAIDPLRTIGLGFIDMVPNLAFLVILVFVTRGALRIIRILFDGLSAGTVSFEGFEPEWAMPTYRLLRLLVIAFSVVVAYPYIPGSESGAFKGVSLFMGIIFSLGSSSLIGNFIAGYSMTYRRAFRIGDRVKIGSYVGDVEQVRLLVTHLRTPKNEEVVVPNSTILSTDVLNYSSMARDRGLILHTTVGIGYETPWRQVEAMLLEASARTPGLREDPSPFVLQTALGDFCVTYEINVYCDNPRAMAALYTELHRNILDVFNEYGVQIMTPAYEGDPEQPKIVPKDQWYTSPARPPESQQSTLSSSARR